MEPQLINSHFPLNMICNTQLPCNGADMIDEDSIVIDSEIDSKTEKETETRWTETENAETLRNRSKGRIPVLIRHQPRMQTR